MRVRLLSLVFLALAACSQPMPPQQRLDQPTAVAHRRREYWPTQDWRTSAPEERGIDGALLAQAGQRLEDAFPHVYSFLVVRDGYLVAERYYRGHDRDDADNVRSITKSVTSALVGIALGEGLIGSLDDPLLEYLPDYRSIGLDPRVEAITLRHLLQMTPGFAWDEADVSRWFSSRDWIAYTLRRPLAHDPGTTFNYDTPASHLLSAVLTRVTGTSESKFASKRLFRPLGIVPGRWDSDPQDHTIGASELYLTPRDLAKLGLLYVTVGVWEDRQIVPVAWIKDSTTAYHTKVGFFGDEGYGYLWWVTQAQGHAAFFAMGYGAQYLYVVPDLDLVVVVTANSDIPPDLLRDPGPVIRSLVLPAVTGTDQ